MSDHDAVVVEVHTGIKTSKKKPREIFLFKRGNCEAVRSDLNKFNPEFSNNFKDRSTNENWIMLRDKINKAIKSHIPTKTVKVRKDLPWINPQTKRLMRKRKRLYNKAKRTDKQEDCKSFRTLRNNIRRELDRAQETFIRGILNTENLRSSPKRFWSFISAKKRDNNSIPPPLETPTGLVYNSKGKTEALSAH